jgi:hypothetical protein
MNDANIEHLLRTLRPAAPSSELTARVERDLALAELFRNAAPAAQAPPAPVKKRATWMSAIAWAGLGAAAAILVMSFLPGRVAAPARGDALASSLQSTAATGILPVSSSREWVAVEDQGISFETPDNPQRQMRVRSLERRQWIDPRDGAEYTVEVPQVDSVVLPVRFQ